MDKKPVAELRKMLKEKRGANKAPSKMSKHELLMELEGHKGSAAQHEMAIQTEEQTVNIPVAKRKLRKEEEAKPEKKEKKTMKIDIGEIPDRKREVSTQTDDMNHRILVPTKKGIKAKPAYRRVYESSSEEEEEREIIVNRKPSTRAEQVQREHEAAMAKAIRNTEDIRGHGTDSIRHQKLAKRIAASYPVSAPRAATNEQREEAKDVKTASVKLVKGSQEARDFMARIRASRKLKKESVD